jgi:hypothetical protein
MVCLIYENIGEVVAPSSILVFHFQYVLSHVFLMYLAETVVVGAGVLAVLAVLAVLVSLVLYLCLVNEEKAGAGVIDNTNDVFYAMVTYSDYCSYYYCSFVITDAHAQRCSFG